MFQAETMRYKIFACMADVSWISLFPHEREVLRKFSKFVQMSLNSVQELFYLRFSLLFS